MRRAGLALGALVSFAACAAPRPPPLPPVVWSELEIGKATVVAEAGKPAPAGPAIDALPRGQARVVVSIERLRGTWAKKPTFDALNAFGGQLTGANDPSMRPCLGKACNGPPVLGPIGSWLYLALDGEGVLHATLGYDGKDEPIEGLARIAERSVPPAAAGKSLGEVRGVTATRGRLGPGVGAYVRAPGVVSAVREGRADEVARALAQGPLRPRFEEAELARFSAEAVPLGPVSSERATRAEGTVVRAADGTSFDLSASLELADTEAAARAASDIRAAADRAKKGLLRVVLRGVLDGLEIVHAPGSRAVRLKLSGSEEQLTSLARLLLATYGGG